MADNITAPGAGAVLATDDLAGVHHPYAKMEFGADGTATPVSTANPLPVVDTALAAYVDTLEALLGTANTLATSLNGYVDGIEGYTDGIEALITATNSSLTTLQGYLDGLEGYTDGIESKLDTLHADLAAGTVATTNAGTSAAAGVPMQGMTGGVPIPVASPGDVITLTPTLDTSAYAVDDVLFTTTSIANAVRANDERALLTSLTVIDKIKANVAFDLYFFTSNVTFGAANAVVSLSDTDALTCIGRVSIVAADYVNLPNNSIAIKANIGQLLESVPGARNIYVAAKIIAGTPTFANGDLVLRFGFLWS